MAKLFESPDERHPICVLACADIKGLMFKVGAVVASMHDGGLIHGDLTTSNLMVRTSDKAVVSEMQLFISDVGSRG